VRVTNNMVVNNVLYNLSQGASRLARYQNQLSSGRRILVPSDDPVGTVNAMYIRSQRLEKERYLKNVEDGLGWLEATERALHEMSDLLTRARELAVQGASETLPESSRAALAAEVGQLLEHAIELANTSYGGKYIFAGFETLQLPFAAVGEPVTSVTYRGDDGGIEREIAPGVTMEVNFPGSRAFGGLYDVFTILAGLRDDLASGDTDRIRTERIGAMDGALDQILGLRAEAGARLNRLELAKNRLEDESLSLTRFLSEEEDADLARVLVQFSAGEAAYRAALTAGARIIQPTLVDFIR